MSTNDITGDSITTATKHNSKTFRDNYDAIFNKEKKMKTLEEEIKKAGESIGVENMTIEQVLDTLIDHVGKVRKALVDVGLIVEEEKQYVYSIDDETFNIESEDEAIELALEEGHEIYSRGVVKHIPKHHLLTANDVINTIADNALDVAGEIASDFPDVSAEGKQELDKFLTEWMDKYCTPWFYLVEDVVEIKIEKAEQAYQSLVGKGIIDVKALSNRHLEEQNSGKDILTTHLDTMCDLHNTYYTDLIKNTKIDYEAMREVGDIISGAEVIVEKQAPFDTAFVPEELPNGLVGDEV